MSNSSFNIFSVSSEAAFATIPLSSETHSGEDVGIFAAGPAALLVNGTNEQSMIYHVMDFAADLSVKANAKQVQ